MQPRADYLFNRLKERVGEQALTEILWRIYSLITIEGQPCQKVVRRLNSQRGRRSKVKKYLTNKSLNEALNLLDQALKQGRISRMTYFRAKKLLRQRF